MNLINIERNGVVRLTYDTVVYTDGQVIERQGTVYHPSDSSESSFVKVPSPLVEVRQ